MPKFSFPLETVSGFDERSYIALDIVVKGGSKLSDLKTGGIALPSAMDRSIGMLAHGATPSIMNPTNLPNPTKLSPSPRGFPGGITCTVNNQTLEAILKGANTPYKLSDFSMAWVFIHDSYLLGQKQCAAAMLVPDMWTSLDMEMTVLKETEVTGPNTKIPGVTEVDINFKWNSPCTLTYVPCTWSFLPFLAPSKTFFGTKEGCRWSPALD